MTKMRAGLLAEFTTADELIAAARHLVALGYKRLDTFTPYPLPGLEEALRPRRSTVPIFVAVLGFLGAGGAYLLQWWMNAYNYPLNVGGRPPHSALAFIIITFEMGVLFAGLTALFAMCGLSGLPRLWTPVFEVPGFERATIDRFWLGLDAADPLFEREASRRHIEDTAPLRIAAFGKGFA